MVTLTQEQKEDVEKIVDEHDIPRIVAVEFFEGGNGCDYNDFIDRCNGRFRGIDDWAEQTLEDQDFFNLDHEIYSKEAKERIKKQLNIMKGYFDFQSYGEDCLMSGDIYSIDGKDGYIYIFRSN